LKTYVTTDKSGWGQGPWEDEPDKAQWVDEATGYDCLIVRNPLGALCGYVGVPPGHACYGVPYDDIRCQGPDDDYIDVHGGLTYSDFCDENADEAKGICHVPLAGRPAKVWWLGFDCAHSMDIAPSMEARDRERGWPPIRFGGGSYRTIEYVQHECASVARQLLTAYEAQPKENT
jgi:hypothetical protein